MVYQEISSKCEFNFVFLAMPADDNRNGQPWPYMVVEPRKYRFRLLNGAVSRSRRPPPSMPEQILKFFQHSLFRFKMTSPEVL